MTFRLGSFSGLAKIFLKGKSCGDVVPITLTDTNSGMTGLGLTSFCGWGVLGISSRKDTQVRYGRRTTRD